MYVIRPEDTKNQEQKFILSLMFFYSPSQKFHSPSSEALYQTHVCCASGFQFGSHLIDFHFGCSGCMFQFMGPHFLYFFQKFTTFMFWGQVQGLGLMFGLRLGFWFGVYLLCLVCFYQAYCTLVVHYCHVTGGGQIKFQI